MTTVLNNKEIAFLLVIGGTIGGLGSMCDEDTLADCRKVIADVKSMLIEGGATRRTMKAADKGFDPGDYLNSEIAYAEAERIVFSQSDFIGEVASFIELINEGEITKDDLEFIKENTTNERIISAFDRMMGMCNAFEG